MTETEAPTPGRNKVLPRDAQRPPGDMRQRRVPKQKRKGPFVKFVGFASRREIDSTAWRSLNISLKDSAATHIWDISNDKMLEVNKFSEDQLDYLLFDDVQVGSGVHNFLSVDYDDDGNLVQVEIV